jgi:hypothetical protein
LGGNAFLLFERKLYRVLRRSKVCLRSSYGRDLDSSACVEKKLNEPQRVLFLFLCLFSKMTS